MKSVLISIQPKWCELIASGEKTIEVRKTAPKLKTPFKCYIYCTLGKGLQDTLLTADRCRVLNGKVIGEFVCDYIWECSDIAGRCFLELNGSCLTLDELNAYSGGKTLYGIQITELVIYKKPKELSEFKSRQRRLSGYKTLRIAPQSWCYVEEL